MLGRKIPHNEEGRNGRKNYYWLYVFGVIFGTMQL
jgi:hypothetical protein